MRCRRGYAVSYNWWRAAGLVQLWTDGNPTAVARDESVLRATGRLDGHSRRGEIRECEEAAQHATVGVLRIGREMAVVVNVMDAVIARRVLHGHGWFVAVQRRQQQHWHEDGQQQTCGQTALVRQQVVHQSDVYFSSRSGRRRLVRSMAWSISHCLILPSLPLSRMSGTFQPL